MTTLWQIDPFGASYLTPTVFGDSEVFDYKYAVLNRIGDEVKDWLMESRQSDFLWKGANNNTLISHVMPKHYSSFKLNKYFDWDP